MTHIFVTKRFVFKCTEERERISCLKFSVDGQFFRAISVYRVNNKCYVVDDTNKEIRSYGTLLNTTKQYIATTYGKIESVITRD